MQFQGLHKHIDALQSRHGAPRLHAVYGTGCTVQPRVMFVFMNPTGRNISTHGHWHGLRAPWLGTKNVWPMFYELGFLPKTYLSMTQTLQSDEWSEDFSEKLYGQLARKKVYVTNLAKCTQVDARPLSDRVFREYRELMLREIALAQPRHIVTFGNQVSSILLERPIRVSAYAGAETETLALASRTYAVYPTYYPVGQGRRNMPLALQRIRAILA